MIRWVKFSVGVYVLLLLSGCERLFSPPEAEAPPITLSEIDVPDDFDYSTKKKVRLNITSHDNYALPLSSVKFDVYGSDDDDGSVRLIGGLSNSDGLFSRDLEVAATITSLQVKTNYIGLVNEITVPMHSNVVTIDYNQLPENNDGGFAFMQKATSAEDLAFLCDFNPKGKPLCLVKPQDPIAQDFLNDINASIPEGESVPDSNPTYLAEGTQINTRLNTAADVFVTFFHDGTSNKNILGYYHYPTLSPPASTAEIDSITVIFPNASFAGGGGTMRPGDKMHLGHFPEGTEIGWVLFVDGWQNRTVTSGEFAILF